GSLTAGTAVTLTATLASTSGLAPILALVSASGAVVALGPAGATRLAYTVPAGGDGAYAARATAAPGTAGLLSQYLLGLDLVDTVPPTVVGVGLPAEGATSAAVIDRFTVTFSKDMAPAVVNDVANLALVDGQHGATYHLASPGYTSGV